MSPLPRATNLFTSPSTTQPTPFLRQIEPDPPDDPIPNLPIDIASHVIPSHPTAHSTSAPASRQPDPRPPHSEPHRQPHSGLADEPDRPAPHRPTTLPTSLPTTTRLTPFHRMTTSQAASAPHDQPAPADLADLPAQSTPFDRTAPISPPRPTYQSIPFSARTTIPSRPLLTTYRPEPHDMPSQSSPARPTVLSRPFLTCATKPARPTPTTSPLTPPHLDYPTPIRPTRRTDTSRTHPTFND